MHDINTHLSESSSIYCLIPRDDSFYLLANDGHGLGLFITDGTQAGTQLIHRLSIGPIDGDNRCNYAWLGSKLFFIADDGLTGLELWVSDGSDAGTHLVDDLIPGPEGSYPESLTPLGDWLYFNAYASEYEAHLFDRAILLRTDGTAQGTQPFTGPEGESYYPWGFDLVENGAVYFRGYGPSGYNAQSYCVVLQPGSACATNGLPAVWEPLAAINGKVFFAAGSSYMDIELWVNEANGTAQQVKNIAPNDSSQIDSGSSRPENLFYLDGWYYFTADDHVHGRAWWRTDGVPGGQTELFLDLIPGSAGFYVNGYPPTVFGDHYFLFTDASNFWVIDTQTITARVVLPACFSRPVPFQDKVVILLDYPPEKSGLWVMDGSPEGTRRIYPQPSIWSYYTFRTTNQPVVLGDKVYFDTNDGEHGNELWVWDGVSPAASLAVDLNQSAAGSYPADLNLTNGKLFFTALDGVDGRALYVSDGVPGGQALRLFTGLSDFGNEFVPLNGQVFFAGQYQGLYDWTLWVSDGTAAGTHPVPLIDPGSGTFLMSSSFWAVTPGGKAFLWKTNPATDGRTMTLWSGSVHNPGVQSLGDFDLAEPMVTFGNMVIFANIGRRADGYYTCDLWRSDGTPQGTFPIWPELMVEQGGFTITACQVTGGAELDGQLFFTFDYFQTIQTDGTRSGTHAAKKPDGKGLSSFSRDIVRAGNSLLILSYEYQEQTVGLWRAKADELALLYQFPLAGDTWSWDPSLVSDGNYAAFRIRTNGVDQLWTSNGTVEGTQSVPGEYTAPGDWLPAGPWLFFYANDPSGSREVWRWTGAGMAAPLFDLNPGSGSSDPRDTSIETLSGLMAMDGLKLYFAANDGGYSGRGYGTELWRVDFTQGQVFLPAVNR